MAIPKSRPINGSGRSTVAPRKLQTRDAHKNDSQRRTKIAKHSRNAAEINRHFIEWNQGHFECKDCGRRVIENNFNVMTNEKCGRGNGVALKYKDIKDTKEGREMERRWSRRAHINKPNTTKQGRKAFTWLLAKPDLTMSEAA